MLRLEGKVAIITGAGSGIGRESALLFTREGARVVVSDYVSEAGEETVRQIKESGGEAIFIKTDVSEASDAERMVKKTKNGLRWCCRIRWSKKIWTWIMGSKS